MPPELVRFDTARVLTALGVISLAAGLAVATPGPTLADTASVHATEASPAERIDAAIAGLDEMVRRIMERSEVPGLAIAVVRDGRIVHAKGFGFRRVGDAAPVTPGTVFQIASLSKSIAATVVAHEVGEGHVAWETPIVSHLPWFELVDPWVTRHVTIADMFSHRSGLPDHAGDELEDLGYDRRTVLERLRFLPLDRFRDHYAYTNFGLTAGAEAVAAAAGKDWATLSAEVLYEPLGMKATSSRYADFLARPDRATLHARTADGYRPLAERLPDAQSPAGGVSSSVEDLARWMIMVLDDGMFEGQRIIAAEPLIAAAQAEVVSAPASSLDTRPGFYGYGIGVRIDDAGQVVLSHSGAFAIGASTHYSMVPALDLGIVVLTNASPSGAAEAIAAEFLDRVETGRSSRDWYAFIAPMMAKLSEPIGRELAANWPAEPRPAAALDAYAGSYENVYYGPADIAVVDGGLTVSLGPSRTRHPLTHRDANVFSFEPRSENEPDGSVATLAFTMGDSGRAEEMRIDYLDMAGLGRFVRH